MRIIGGSHKGKRIVAPAKLPIRPTTDFAKEGLFNILHHHFAFQGLRALDLYAGSGSISYEFASRGCSQVIAVEAHAGCIDFIRKMARELFLPIQTIKSEVYKFLEKTTQQADIIFADPPYEFTPGQLSQLVALIFQRQLLAPQGWLIIEHFKRTGLETLPYFMHTKKYGSSAFSFFGWENG